MSQGVAQVLLLLPSFFTIESTRAILWAARAAYDPDRNGGLLRALYMCVVGILGVVPSPVWTVMTYTAYVAWVPVRAILWIWGIGRGGSLKKRSPSAVIRWYAHTRVQRAEKIRRQRRGGQLWMNKKRDAFEDVSLGDDVGIKW